MPSVERMHQGRPLVAGFGVTVVAPRLPEQVAASLFLKLAEVMLPSTLAPSFLVTVPVNVATSHDTRVLPSMSVMTVLPLFVARMELPTFTVPAESTSSGLLVADATAGTTAKAMIAAQKARIFFAMFE